MIQEKSCKKILFIHHTAGWGGAPNSMIKIINALDKDKYCPFVLLLKDSIVSQKLNENSIPYKIAGSNFYKKFYRYYGHIVPSYTKWYRFYHVVLLTLSWILSRYYFAPKELKNLRFDLVHLNSSVLTDWLAPCKARGKVIIHIREPLTKGDFGIRFHFFRKQILKYADIIIAISNDNARRLDLLEKTKVIYNYTTIPDVTPLIESYSSKKVLYVGGASIMKGFHILVQALKYINFDIQIIFAGNYPKDIIGKSLKQRIKYFLPSNKIMVESLTVLRKSNNAVEVGLVSDISELLKEVCCLVSPFSIEHFSRPIIEAFAFQKPAIATKIIGIEEIVDDRTDGIIVAKDNPIALAEAINFLCNNPKIAKDMGEAGYKKAVRLYTPTNIYRIADLYDLLLK